MSPEVQRRGHHPEAPGAPQPLCASSLVPWWPPIWALAWPPKMKAGPRPPRPLPARPAEWPSCQAPHRSLSCAHSAAPPGGEQAALAPGPRRVRRAHVTKLTHRQVCFTGWAFRRLHGCPTARGQCRACLCVPSDTGTRAHPCTRPVGSSRACAADTGLPSLAFWGVPPNSTHIGKQQSRATAL